MMDRKPRTLLTMTLLIAGFGLICLLLVPQKPSDVAVVHMLNVGQGDSFLVQAHNGKQILIDGGRDAQVLVELARVMPKGDRSIDVVVATHPDADHIGGLSHVLSRYSVGLFLTAEVMAETEQFKVLMQKVDEKNVPAYYVRRGMKLTLDNDTALPAQFSILFPDRPTTYWQTNSASVIGRLQFGESSMLLTGDAPIAIEEFLLRADAKNTDVDILKLGHHGSKTSSSEAFLQATSPVLALISAGVNNRYGHPATEVTDRLNKFAIPFISTQDKGTISLSSDGYDWAVQQ